MKIQLIRNATMKIEYAGRIILTDPMLSGKGAFMPFAFKARNPVIDLSMPVQDVLNGVDAVLVSHMHPDHLDKIALENIPKALPVFSQPKEQAKITAKGFENVRAIDTSTVWEGITISRTAGRHGIGWIEAITGKVSGFVLQADGEPTVYWTGDTVWCEEVRQAIARYHPEVIITHSGGARLPAMKPIIMDEFQTIESLKAAPGAVGVAIHMEALDHCGVTRKKLRTAAEKSGIDKSRLFIPADGETITFS